MSAPSAPEVDCEQQHARLPVSDVLAAVDFYKRKLGFRLAFTWGDPPAMAGVNLGNEQMFLELEAMGLPVGAFVRETDLRSGLTRAGLSEWEAATRIQLAREWAITVMRNAH
jgi:catechol 2,3-dioxygenase-like lactoylglutathione lyase family enzyme